MPALNPVEPGTRFARLIVLGSGPRNKHKQTTSICLCDCDSRATILNISLRSGLSTSCGCRAKDLSRARATHGHNRVGYRAGTYITWSAMLTRCFNPNQRSYRDYGARGITVCERWLRFENFLADMGERPDHHTLERKDNNGNYEPSNCKWATTKEQSRNTSRTLRFTIDGIAACAKDHASRLGINYGTLKSRLESGWTPELAFKK